MTVQEIMDAWRSRPINTEAELTRWNGKAAHFGSGKLPTAETSMAMRLIQRENMVKPGDCVLDVGCGGGQFSFALEKLGARAVGVDLSPDMVEACERNRVALASSARFFVCDWHTANMAEMGWEKGFDLVLAHMTPAVASAETFVKLSEASRGWCLMVKPTRRTNSVLDVLNAMVGAPRETETLNDTVAYAFDLLWLSGMKPKMDYEEQVWKIVQTLPDAIREYTARISSTHDLTRVQSAAICDYLEGIAVDGMVHETTHTLVAAMYWQV